MRLIRAELRKLGRPLTWGVAGAAAVFCVLLAVGGAHNAALEGSSPVGHLPSCAELGIPAGPQCTRATARERARVAQASAQPAQVAAQLNPLAAGAEAAGLMASLPGALALALLAGAHAGGEWSGRTLKNLLTQQGWRWPPPGRSSSASITCRPRTSPPPTRSAWPARRRRGPCWCWPRSPPSACSPPLPPAARSGPSRPRRWPSSR